MKKIKAALIGAGQRGMDSYAVYALKHPNELEFVAVAEPDEDRRNKFAKLHDIYSDMVFESWEELLDRPKLCEALLICTQDSMHYEPTMKALDAGYDILLEKPMSNRLEECVDMADKADEKNRLLMICHVLRYTKVFNKLKQILDSGVIGDIVSIQHNENVGFFHQAHSFVRGNWRKSKETSPMILAKSCHDMDILNYLIGKRCLSISSYGSLKLFKEENAPAGVPDRCTDGCPEEDKCPFNALGYLENRQYRDVFRKVVSDDTSEKAVIEALKTGPYGRCVYKCDNDVVDHQVVNMLYEEGITAVFTMCAFTNQGSRTIKIMGTEGEIRGHIERGEIEISDFLTGNMETVKINADSSMHSGGDEGIMKAFINQVKSKDKNPLTSASVSVQSHEMAFAAEKSRLEGKMIKLGR